MQAHAFVVGPSDGPGAALLEMAQGVGFEGVSAFTTLARAEHQAQATPVCFFLFAATEDTGLLRSVADAIRFSPTRRLRFSPLIYFAETPSVDAISSCIQMGFDDIITMPFTLRRVRERLDRQVGQPLVYYETPSYFGPDRRRTAREDLKPTGGEQFRRLEIVRSLLSGINVIRDDHLSGAAV